MKPVNFGVALAITVAITYSICALLVAFAPTASIAFLNAFFHVVDFGRIAAPEGFRLQSFLAALSIFVVWAFAAGTLFAWMLNRLSAGNKTVR